MYKKKSELCVRASNPELLERTAAMRETSRLWLAIREANGFLLAVREANRRLLDHLADTQRLAAKGSPEKLLRLRLQDLLGHELKNRATRTEMLLRIVRLLENPRPTARGGYGCRRRSILP